MDLSSKRIGIWGFGVVGKSVANYLHLQGHKLEILERRELTDLEKEWLQSREICFAKQDDIALQNFLQSSDIIIPSPGIDLSQASLSAMPGAAPYMQYKDKFLCELDLFAANFKKPIIAITGTLGKTSTTHLMTKLFCMQGLRAVAAGNIGLGMCDLLLKQDEIDLVVLEVSSFQLEQLNLFKPNISIWTNFYPNHLDRHPNIKSYFDAKRMIMSKQDINGNALLPFNLRDDIYLNRPDCKINFFTTNNVTQKDFELLKDGDSLFYIKEGNIYRYSPFDMPLRATQGERDEEKFPVRGDPLDSLSLTQDERVYSKSYLPGVALAKPGSNHEPEFIYSLENLPEITFIENWLIICATFYLYKIHLNIDVTELDIPEHRLEKFAQINTIEFYNDSKSTVPESTLAAVSKFKPAEVVLFLGGLSKGVDRSILIKELKNKVKTIICFGKEADQLKTFCDLNEIPAYKSNTLEEAVNICMSVVKENDKVLFSPAGSSYDLFSIYSERGKIFKQLILRSKL